ncbi:MAG: metal-dependent transcriptional regulator [Fervidobacterium sp.]|nr:metal-dependent transcriptional regulator [Fervidobacterium sp.]
MKNESRHETKLTPTVMSYVSTIYTLVEKEGVARISDIARSKNVSYASATNAVKKLVELGLVDHKRYGFVKLTTRGLRIAQMLRSGESRIKYFFMYVVGVPEKKAEQIASLIVYDLDQETRRKLRKFYSILIDFTVDKAKELEQFIKEQRMNLEIPEEVLKLKEKIKEDEVYE